MKNGSKKQSLPMRSQPFWAAWIEMLTNLTTANVDGSRSPLGLRELDSGMMSDDEMEFHEINQLMAKKYKYSYRRVRR